jgi:PIN domain nuclease of toxin-antitoxin system
MILLDTHTWLWWVHGDVRLPRHHLEAIKQSTEIGVSVISCWEVAKLTERGRLNLPVSLEEWLNKALRYPRLRLLDLTPQIAIESTRLPAGFHRDPADQIIVATARIQQCPIVTSDEKILAYPHVTTINNE